jgi:hypothetical protein
MRRAIPTAAARLVLPRRVEVTAAVAAEAPPAAVPVAPAVVVAAPAAVAVARAGAPAGRSPVDAAAEAADAEVEAGRVAREGTAAVAGADAVVVADREAAVLGDREAAVLGDRAAALADRSREISDGGARRWQGLRACSLHAIRSVECLASPAGADSRSLAPHSLKRAGPGSLLTAL